MVVKAKKLNDLGTTVSLISLSTALRINDFNQRVRRETCVHVVRNATPLQLISTYSSPSLGFVDFPRFSGHRWLSESPAVRTPPG
jgi:hypothetical protein